MSENASAAITCIDCGATEHVNRVCDLCFQVRVVSDRIPDGDWDVHVWDHHGVSGHRPGRVDVADRKRLLRIILAAAQNGS